MYCALDRSKPCPFPIPPTATYLGEDMNGYYVMDGFVDGLGNMFKRMVKFTPKSFTPGNLYKGFVNTALTAASMGTYQLLPKNVRKAVYNVGKIAIPVIAGGVAAYTMGPAVMSMLGPKLSMAGSLLGKGASSVGGSLFQSLMKLPASQQSRIAQQVTAQDIAYAESHGGQYPPHVQAMIEQAERESYLYAAQQAANGHLNPTGGMIDPAIAANYASSELYPGLKAYEESQQAERYGQPHPGDGGSTGVGVGVLAVAGGAILLLFAMKR